MAPATHDRSVTSNAPANPSAWQGVRARCLNALSITFVCGLLGACATATTHGVDADGDDSGPAVDAGNGDIAPDVDDAPDGSADPGEANPSSDSTSDTAPDVAQFCV